jgi:hypothetical protein
MVRLALMVASAVLFGFQEETEAARREREKKHDAAERSRSLKLVTLDFPEAPLSDVLKELQERVGVPFQWQAVGRKKVKVVVTAQPLIKVLESIEDQADVNFKEVKGAYETPEQPGLCIFHQYSVLPGKAKRLPRVHLGQSAVQFEVKEYRVDGKRVGRILRARDVGSGHVNLESVVVSSADGKAKSIQQCGSCSPRLIMIPGDDKGELRLKLKGDVQWNSEYEFRVKDPAKPETFQVGDCTAVYEFPKVRITSPKALPPRDFPYASLDGKLKGLKYIKVKTADRVKESGPPKGWCWCSEGPKPWPSGPERVAEKEYKREAYSTHTAADFDWIQVTVGKKFNEPVEGEIVIPPE